jgi:hypothetical protein
MGSAGRYRITVLEGRPDSVTEIGRFSSRKFHILIFNVKFPSLNKIAVKSFGNKIEIIINDY